MGSAHGDTSIYLYLVCSSALSFCCAIMSGPKVQQLQISPVTCHAYNKDRTAVAICPNSKDVHIYRKSGDKWNHSETLSQHDHRVMGVDWAPNSDTIVTCGMDRNAYVWTPGLVLLRITRAATCVKWSPNEKKFAVGTGDRVTCICSYDEEGDWWVSKHIKSLQSTVLSVDWHPNNVLLAIGTVALKTMVFSTYLKGEDEKPGATVWGSKMPFGKVMAEFKQEAGGWEHSVAFNADGDKLAWVSHNAQFTVAEGPDNVFKVPTKMLPMVEVEWSGADACIAAGHDCVPVLFAKEGGKWTYKEKLEQKKKKAAGNMSAMNRFKQLDSKGEEDNTNETVLASTHQNAICDIKIVKGSKYAVEEFSPTGNDGRLVLWSVKSIESQFAGLKIN